MYEQNYTLLDIINILSFILQVQNQDHIIDIKDIQQEFQKLQNKIDSHLQNQDNKIDEILKYIKENSGE